MMAIYTLEICPHPKSFLESSETDYLFLSHSLLGGEVCQTQRVNQLESVAQTSSRVKSRMLLRTFLCMHVKHCVSI